MGQHGKLKLWDISESINLLRSLHNSPTDVTEMRDEMEIGTYNILSVTLFSLLFAKQISLTRCQFVELLLNSLKQGQAIDVTCAEPPLNTYPYNKPLFCLSVSVCLCVGLCV